MHRFLLLSQILILILLSNNLCAQNYKKDWKKLSEGEVENYFYEKGYNYQGKEWSEQGTVHTGVKHSENGKISNEQKITFYFKNSRLTSRTYIDRSRSEWHPIEGLGLMILEETWKDRVKFHKELLKGYKILVDNNNRFETDWKKLKDGSQKCVITLKNVYENTYDFIDSWFYVLDKETIEIGGVDITEMDTYNLKPMVEMFMRDLFFHSQKFDARFFNLPNEEFYQQKIKIQFIELEGTTLALSYGLEIPNEIVIAVDPRKWEASNLQKKWYVLYHELGHDVLEFQHGEGGKMMFNFVDRDYSWGEFINDKERMFDIFLNNKEK